MMDTVVRLATEEPPTLNGLGETDVRRELDRILRSRVFVHSRRIRRFLQFVVEECLLQKHHRLKEYLIGLEVFNRQETFDPRVDSIVRVEARRLRSKLEEYYMTEGQDSEIRIQLRKGSYVPTFEHRGSGIMSRMSLTSAIPRRILGMGTITVFNGGDAHEAAVEDVKRQVAHVLIKEGFFHVVGMPGGPVDATTKAEAVVEGSMHFHSDKVNVILQLLNTADSSYIWSEQTACELDDLSPVEELARSLNRVLVTSMSGDGARVRRHGADRHSYDLYLQGRFHWKPGTPEGIRESVSQFEKAVERDPNYCAAWAALSQALLASSIFGYVNSPELTARTQEAARQAVSLNENLPEAHLAQGGVLSILEWNWDAGERELQRAIQLSPSDPSAHMWYGIQLACRRMTQAAVAELETALELDPASLSTNFALGWLHTVSGNHDEALQQHRVVAQIAPDFALSYLGLGWAMMGKGDYHDAIAHFTNAANLLKVRPLIAGCLGYCYARLGDKEEALRQIPALQGAANEREPVRQNSPVNAAAIFAGLGDIDRALSYLAEAAASHDPSLPLRTLTPEFDALRDEPRFRELLRVMRLERTRSQGAGVSS